MKKYVLDTNSLLRLLLDDIPTQKRATEKLLKQAKNGKIFLLIPQIVIFEINFVLTSVYHKEKNEVIENIEPIISVPYIDIESRDLFSSALALYKGVSISFVDCFLLVTAISEGAELFTFDRKLKKLS